MPYALIVDDDVDFTPSLARLIQQEGYSVRIAKTLEEARQELREGIPDVALIDLLLPDGDGIQLVRELTLTGSTKVLVITGYAGVDNAVAALRAGVTDYLQKPFDIDQLKKQLRITKNELASHTNTSALSEGMEINSLLGQSPQIQTVHNLIEKVSSTETTVFIYGESGTGKELVAHAIHSMSARSNQPFIAINCAAISPQLIATEFFGHEKGAFTDAHSLHKGCFERAEGGTLFLDEVTEMPIDLQVQLLRALESRRIMRVGGTKEIDIDIRIIAATNRPPHYAVEEGKLREDLLFRLMVFPIYLPPLRERQGDIIHLAKNFLSALNEKENGNKAFSDDSLEFLSTARWPGNIRELKNAVQHAYILAGDRIEPQHFPPQSISMAEDNSSPLRFTVGTSLDEFEKRFILATLDHYNGDKRSAAEVLGVSLKTLYNRLNNYQNSI